jgi:hypothetical protein
MAEKCGMKTEVYSRVVGYFRPLAAWNEAKKEEFKLRKPFSTIGGSINAILTERKKQKES